MCLILLAYESHPAYRLVLAANRDEHRSRPTAAAAFWDDAPRLLAGRDLLQGGTWLGITRNGRFAALTNYREPATYLHGAPSRGLLVSNFLRGEMTADEYLAFLRREGRNYNGFCLLFGTAERLRCHSNRTENPPRLEPGIHGLSNHHLDSPWPKVVRGKEALARLIAPEGELDPEDLFSLLADRSPVPDHLLPDTGAGIERERALAPLFIDTPGYGTRSSTILLITRSNTVTFVERTFDGSGDDPRTVSFRLTLPS